MDAREFKLFIEQAASLPRRQRIDLAEALKRGLRQEQTGWRWALDGNRISSPEMLLRSALGAIPDLTVT